jgi:hypothetical protein
MSMSNGHHPDPEPGDDHDDADRRPGPQVAYAVNWLTVLAVDGAMGVVVVAAGLIALIVWNFYVGAFLMLVGCLYVALVVRRGDRWRRLRRDAGL